MTSRGMYEAVLIELNKENAPNILLEDFNYFANKAVNLYINKRYNIYDINQQTTDDLRVLKATAMLNPVKISDYNGLSLASNATYEVILPQDYLHILNCICIYDVKKTYKCYNKGDSWRAPAKRLTADAYSQVLDNFWNKPTYKKPYYYIHNVNYPINNILLPTDPVRPFHEEEELYYFSDGSVNTSGTAPDGAHIVLEVSYAVNKDTKWTTVTTVPYKYNEELEGWIADNESRIVEKYPPKGTDFLDPKTESFINEKSFGVDGNNKNIVSGNRIGVSIALNGGSKDLIDEYSNVERGAQIRYGNVSQVRLEIRYGTDDSVFGLSKVYIDYIKAPQNIRLTQEELDYTEDKSQMIEFPDYVCQEIINELVHLIMENITDQRLQTHPVVSLSIANPAQQLTEPVAQLLPT